MTWLQWITFGASWFVGLCSWPATEYIAAIPMAWPPWAWISGFLVGSIIVGICIDTANCRNSHKEQYPRD